VRYRCRISGSVLSDQVSREPWDPRAVGFTDVADDDSLTGFPPVLDQPADVPPLPQPGGLPAVDLSEE
jgi:hypothetical protein